MLVGKFSFNEIKIPNKKYQLILKYQLKWILKSLLVGNFWLNEIKVPNKKVSINIKVSVGVN